MKKFRVLQVGTGGFGGAWCEHFLPPNIKDGLIEVVGAVDKNEKHFETAKRCLGLDNSRLFTDAKKAFDTIKADFCTIVVPPSFHESIVDLALSHDMDILSEKPIADTLEGSVRIAEKVRKSGKKMGVTMSHRFDEDKTKLRELIRSGKYGKLDYVIGRFLDACRKFGSWGEFRHKIPDALMVEGAVHHLDIIADLCGGKCDTIYAQTWNPSWGEYAGDSEGLVMMKMENGTRNFYEGSESSAKRLNGWTNEYFRAECDKAGIELNKRVITIRSEGKEDEIIKMEEKGKWANVLLIEKYVHWLAGGEPMETNVSDNLQSVALVFAAIESSKTGKPVKVQELLKSVKEKVKI
ncbi:MAG: Gfo/Idh/MocA family oxidoreductase [Candidatus Firestonebacteria bacterium]